MPYRGNYCCGQVPGATYSAQVIDEAGRGLYAGWFFLDSNGAQITNDFFTDSAGFFHYTVPLQNHENIFIQLYATDKFQTRVLSFEELTASPVIVLSPKTKQDKTPWVIAAGLGVLFLIGKKVKGFR